MIPIRLPWRPRARPSATLHEILVCSRKSKLGIKYYNRPSGLSRRACRKTDHSTAIANRDVGAFPTNWHPSTPSMTESPILSSCRLHSNPILNRTICKKMQTRRRRVLHLRTTSTGRGSRPKLFSDLVGFSLAGSAFGGILLAVTGPVFLMQTVIALDGPNPPRWTKFQMCVLVPCHGPEMSSRMFLPEFRRRNCD